MARKKLVGAKGRLDDNSTVSHLSYRILTYVTKTVYLSTEKEKIDKLALKVETEQKVYLTYLPICWEIPMLQHLIQSYMWGKGETDEEEGKNPRLIRS